MSGLAGALLYTPNAQACGGTFCNGQQPVDQAGEDILFVIDGETVEAHIRIAYLGDAEQFAWLLPLPAVPEFAVGSAALIDALGVSTSPQFGVQREFESCAPPPSGDGDGDSGDGDGDGDGDGGDTDGFVSGSDQGGGPDIVIEETVGAYDAVVLQGDDVASVVEWLNTNGFSVPVNSEAILAEYIEEGHYFAAFKLSNGAYVDEIHPIVVRYPGTEACIPLRLTSVAATPDMPVRAYFLGNERAVPTGYAHAELNLAKLDWNAASTSYPPLVSAAVDEAGRRSFITEYAGSSSVLPQSFVPSQWNPDAFVGLDPTEAVTKLNQQGLVWCTSEFNCQMEHPLMAPILHEFLPVPEGMAPATFWADLAAYEGLIDQQSWNGTAFANRLDERIVEPAINATDLVQTWPYLTRLSTVISPIEMSTDPFFRMAEGLPDVPRLANAETYQWCDGDLGWTFPSGARLCDPAGPTGPEALVATLPAALRAEVFPSVGPAQVLFDYDQSVRNTLAQWNEAHRCGDDEGDSGGDSGEDPGSQDGDTKSAQISGCACALAEDADTGLLWAGLALLGFGRRRRVRS